MQRIKLIIKFQKRFLCEMIHNEIDFIHVPNYFDQESFSNISIFITLLFHGLLDANYYSKINLKDAEWDNLFEIGFIPDFLFPIDENTYLYDMDLQLEEQPLPLESTLNHLLPNLTFISEKENQILNFPENNYINEESPYGFHNSITFINPDILSLIKKLKVPRTDKDVLLMYSGGKDSTLTAIRLVKMGYQVHFIHFDNGYMRDTNKPFLTFQKTFSRLEGYHFPYQFSSVNIKDEFESLFKNWKSDSNCKVEHGSIDSEIQCLSCRSAMYLTAIAIAQYYGYKYIAEGARISQKFLIEQPIMLDRFKELATQYGIELLFPVLTLENDKVEIEELLQAGFSAKSWESKCLLGKEAKSKTSKDNKEILAYYDTYIKPTAKQKIYQIQFRQN